MTTKAEELATVPKGMEALITLDRPSGHDEGELGSEGIGRDDILMPRLGLAQKMSPELDPSSTRCIEGLKFAGLYNSVTGQTYGSGPLYFVILRRDNPRWIEFNPIENGGGIKDRDVKASDPRTAFGPNGEKPLATKFYDFIVLLLNDLNPAEAQTNILALSFKGSGLKAAKNLGTLIKLRGQKLICKGVYALTTSTALDKKSGQNYAVFEVKNAGWLPADSPIEAAAVAAHEAWKAREVVIDHEGDDDPAAMGGGDASHGDDKVPF